MCSLHRGSECWEDDLNWSAWRLFFQYFAWVSYPDQRRQPDRSTTLCFEEHILSATSYHCLWDVIFHPKSVSPQTSSGCCLELRIWFPLWTLSTTGFHPADPTFLSVLDDISDLSPCKRKTMCTQELICIFLDKTKDANDWNVTRLTQLFRCNTSHLVHLLIATKDQPAKSHSQQMMTNTTRIKCTATNWSSSILIMSPTVKRMEKTCQVNPVMKKMQYKPSTLYQRSFTSFPFLKTFESLLLTWLSLRCLWKSSIASLRAVMVRTTKSGMAVASHVNDEIKGISCREEDAVSQSHQFLWISWQTNLEYE